MADHLKFEPLKPSPPECLHCEELLADAVDELLSPADQIFFDRHIATCADCMGALADARRGAAWLEMLKTPRPEPSAQLLERILSATSGAEAGGVQTSAAAGQGIRTVPQIAELPDFQPAAPYYPPRVLPFRPRLPQFNPHQFRPHLNLLNRVLFEPRLALTAAMAFFSIALTLNLAGVRLNELHADDLGPAGIRRSYYQATASVARRCEGLRVVHTLESRVDDLRETNQLGQPGEGTDNGDLPRTPAVKPEADRPEPRKASPPAPEPKHGPDGGVSRDATPLGEPHFLPVGDGKRLGVTRIPFTRKEGGVA